MIVTPNEAFLEIGVKDGVNGFVLDYDMKNVDVQKIYESDLKFEYKPLKDNYDNILQKGESKYQKELKEMVEVQCIKPYTDIQIGEYKTPQSKPYIVSLARGRELEEKRLVKILREI